MSERWVLNASPLIVLARAGYEDLLLKLPEQVVVPKAVETEIQAGPAAEVMRSLKAVGLRLDETVVREALKRTVGEDW